MNNNAENLCIIIFILMRFQNVTFVLKQRKTILNVLGVVLNHVVNASIISILKMNQDVLHVD